MDAIFESATSPDLLNSQVPVQLNWNNTKKFSFFKRKIKDLELFLDSGKLLMNNLFHFGLLFECTGTVRN